MKTGPVCHGREQGLDSVAWRPLEQKFSNKGVTGSDSNCRRRFWLQRVWRGPEGLPGASVRGHCAPPGRGGNCSVGHVCSPWERTKVSQFCLGDIFFLLLVCSSYSYVLL